MLLPLTLTMWLTLGFWEESENLDRELSLFVAGMWICLDSPSSNEPYYYNQVLLHLQARSLVQL